MAYRVATFGPSFGNTCCYVIASRASDDALIVDPGQDSEGWVEKTLGHRRARAVLLTHAHMDHAWASQPLADRMGIPVVLAECGHRFLEEPEAALPATFPGELLEGHPRRRPAQLLPPLRTFDVGGLTVHTLATPGHTSDSVSYIIDVDEERLVCTGDTVLGGGHIGTPVPPLGNDVELKASFSFLARELRDVTVLPGHGAPFTTCARGISTTVKG